MCGEFKERSIGVGLVVAVLAALGSLGTLCWALARASPQDLRLWALLATVALPLVALGGWWLGRRDARERLAGIADGVGQVMQAADQTANLRVNILRTTQPVREPTPPTIITLPHAERPVFQDPPRLQAGEIVEL